MKAACPLETRERGHTRIWPQETRETEAEEEQNRERERESRTFGRKAARIRSPAHMNVHPTCNYIGLRVEFPMRSVSGFVEVWPTHGPGRVIAARISQVSRVDCQTRGFP